VNSFSRYVAVFGLCLALCSTSVEVAGAPNLNPSPATPPELVSAYDDLASAILAVKKTETSLVRSILATTYGHARAAYERAQRAMKSGDSQAAQKALEDVAAYVAQLGTEGDNAVAGIRKRLIEGGHHHNALGEAQGIYDPGFVVVPKTVKKELLEASRNIAQLAKAPNEDAIAREWKKVEQLWANLQKK
jgi:hypothetical protein